MAITPVTTVTFPGESLDFPTLTGSLLRPPVPAATAPSALPPTTRHPVVVALHGCSGYLRQDGALNARSRDWAERWVAAGYAVLFPDSFGSRGLGPQCRTRDPAAAPSMRVRDARAAANWIATQPFADPSRIALVGWSHGGSTTLLTAGSTFRKPAHEFVTAIAFYPGCRLLAERGGWTPRVPLTVLIGEADDWTPAAPCRTLMTLDAVAQRGGRLVTYPGAHHAFDAPNQPVRALQGLAFTADGTGTAHAGTEPAARAAAIEAVMAQLSAAFAKP